MKTPTDTLPFVLEEWDADHSRMEEFILCMEQATPEQCQFVQGEYSRNLACYLCVALQHGKVVGFLRFGIQPIGPETRCPALTLDGMGLKEAKIHAFGVKEEQRNQGIGKALQKWAIARAKSLGCYQLVSHSAYESEANFHVKLSLGFAAQPENGAVYFLMPLCFVEAVEAKSTDGQEQSFCFITNSFES